MDFVFVLQKVSKLAALAMATTVAKAVANDFLYNVWWHGDLAIAVALATI